MVKIEQLAESAIKGESLLTRSLTQEFFRENHRLNEIPCPLTNDPIILAASAALIELFATRMKQAPPAWTKKIGHATEPVFLLKAATTMKNLRTLCETESPEPLRKRGFYAPPNYLEFV